MITKKEFPILEFDTDKIAKINPENLFPEKFSADKMIISFFPEAINKLIEEKQVEVYMHIGGENPFDVYKFVDVPDVLLILGQVGCPACAGNLDALQAGGLKKVMFCGGGGVLDRNIKVTDKLAASLEAKKVPYLRGLCWTTDAMLRETADRVEQRKSEGAKIVEM